MLPKIPYTPQPPISPCIPSPCGANADCRAVGDRPLCSCQSNMLGAPPNCRPECVINQDCPSHLACINTRCTNPCAGSCGYNAECTVYNHQPSCVCANGFEGDPFSGCTAVQGKFKYKSSVSSFHSFLGCSFFF